MQLRSTRPPRRSCRSAIPCALVAALAACADGRALEVVPESALGEHYLLDLEHVDDAERGIATESHVLVFNPGSEPARLVATVYFEARAPERLTIVADPARNTDLRTERFPARAGERFAVRLESDRPVACQATVGWTNTRGDYRPAAVSREPEGQREVARSYLSTRALATDWLVVDGVVLDAPDELWIRESEWALLLNPNPDEAAVTLELYYPRSSSWKRRIRDGLEGRQTIDVVVPGERLVVLALDARVRPNTQYSVHARSDRPVALHWLREVRWNDRDVPMTSWSVAGVPLADAGRGPATSTPPLE